MKKQHLLSLTILFILGSCTYNVEEELFPVNNCNTIDITYSLDVEPIIQSNCYVCHDSASRLGGITLEGYDNLKAFVDNGRLIGVINHQSGFSPMPKGAAKLPDCDIAAIEQWVAEGAKDN